MKTYEKPRLMFLSLSGNDQLCGSCSDSGGNTIYDNEVIKNELLLAGDKNGDGELSREEAAFLFGLSPADGCANKVGMYCKFQSVGNMLVAWS